MSGWDRSVAIAHLNKSAQPASVGRCARYTREAIEAGGLLLNRTLFAKDYGPLLEAAGFRKVSEPAIGDFRAGDVVVIEGFAAAPEGHMAMFNGQSWVSDFVQREIYPGPAYRSNKPSYTIYRIVVE